MTMHWGANLLHSTNFANISILVDTNVVSELIRISPNPAVKKWADIQPVESLNFSAVSEAELRFGAAILPLGRRRDRLFSKIENLLCVAFDNRVLPFDSEAARSYAELATIHRASGFAIPIVDIQIAAIPRSRGMTVATRNIRDFKVTGIKLVSFNSVSTSIRSRHGLDTSTLTRPTSTPR